LRSQESREYAESVKSELIMVFRASVLIAVLIAGLATAPIALADNRHGHEQWHGGRGDHHGNNVAPAIIGGLIGLGVGAAIASGGYGYYAPPPVYYGPPPGYYAPPPPAVYYGY
jgi:hypothetical protein